MLGCIKREGSGEGVEREWREWGVWEGVYGKVRQGGEESKDGFVLCVWAEMVVVDGSLDLELEHWERGTFGGKTGEFGVAYNEVTYNSTVGGQ